MNNLHPNQIYLLSKHAYDLAERDNHLTREGLRMALPFIDIKSLKKLSATSGLFTPVVSGFGFMARLNGGRSTEIVIATRGTASMADVGTDLNTLPARGPTGHQIHQGFGSTFTSYVKQLNEFLNQQKLGFKPTAVHCMGHSLGGALANLNAAACAELGMNSFLYTVASPYVHGTYLIEGGQLKINPMQHMLSNGYKAMVNSSWKQMESMTRSRQLDLANSMFPAHRQDASQFEHMVRLPGAMFSGRLLKMINMAINDMLSRLGAQSLLCVSSYSSGAFTVLDQLAEILARYAQASAQKNREIRGMLNAVMHYLGRSGTALADASMTTIRWVFGLLHQSVNVMANQAINLVTR